MRWPVDPVLRLDGADDTRRRGTGFVFEKTAEPTTTPSCSTAMRFPGVCPGNSSNASAIAGVVAYAGVCSPLRHRSNQWVNACRDLATWASFMVVT